MFTFHLKHPCKNMVNENLESSKMITQRTQIKPIMVRFPSNSCFQKRFLPINKQTDFLWSSYQQFNITRYILLCGIQFYITRLLCGILRSWSPFDWPPSRNLFNIYIPDELHDNSCLIRAGIINTVSANFNFLPVLNYASQIE